MFIIQSIPCVCVCITEAHSETQPFIKNETFSEKIEQVFTISEKTAQSQTFDLVL